MPFTLIGDQYTIGYYNDEVTGKEIEKKLQACIANGCKDIISQMKGEKESAIETIHTPINIVSESKSTREDTNTSQVNIDNSLVDTQERQQIYT